MSTDTRAGFDLNDNDEPILNGNTDTLDGTILGRLGLRTIESYNTDLAVAFLYSEGWYSGCTWGCTACPEPINDVRTLFRLFRFVYSCRLS